MINFTQKEHYSYEDLLALVRVLRAPDGCPWDSVQDHHSIRRCFLEEVAEVCEAIDCDDADHLREELGDVLYQVVFHADLEREAGRFGMPEVIDDVCKKLIARHPALFAPDFDESVTTADSALATWEAQKRRLNGYATTTESMQAVCRTLPALWRAEKLRNKAAGAGYGTASAAEAADRLARQTDKNALTQEDTAQQALGELLFAAVDLAAHLHVDPESALHAACESYIRRFAAAESAANDGEINKTKEKRILL